MAFMSSSDMVDMSWPACGAAAGVAVAVGVGAGTGAGAGLRADGAGVRVVAGCRPGAALGVSFVGSAASSGTGPEATGDGVATPVSPPGVSSSPGRQAPPQPASVSQTMRQRATFTASAYEYNNQTLPRYD